MRQCILQRVFVQICSNKQVKLAIPADLGTDVTSWAGKCWETVANISNAVEKFRQICPDQGEWVLANLRENAVVMRERNILCFYYALCYFAEGYKRQIRLVYIDRCLLCSAGANSIT